MKASSYWYKKSEYLRLSTRLGSMYAVRPEDAQGLG